MLQYFRPDNLEAALLALSETDWTLLAGGTDFYPARVGKPITENVLDLTALEELRSIRKSEEGYTIGALTSWTDIIAAELPPAFAGLKKAAKTIGGIQTQNAGTLCGNICNASPAADAVPNLLALEATVQLKSSLATRSLSLEKFILGNRKTARKADELVSGIFIPRPGENAVGNFEKLGTRSYLVISIVMVGVVAELNVRDEILQLKVAVGACSPVAQRLKLLEEECKGQKINDIEIQSRHLEQLEPIDDVRASAAYRISVIPELLGRAIKGIIQP
ncbi:MAG: FAD binding domain-containing protein [SAR324 cluster bacterium]|nr:FAD binding domain-containing protein [SAR324 cluster bacterium]MBL7034286.1 FAD binding domain-containing protein [SAR324 cluster bacterium]